MWPLLLPDAVCMARRITELQPMLRSGLTPASTSEQPHDDDQHHQNDQHQRHPRARHRRHSDVLVLVARPDAAAESRSPARRRAGSRSRRPARAPQASRPRSARRTAARTATAQRRPTSSGSRPPGQPTVRRWPGVRRDAEPATLDTPPTSGRRAGWQSMMSAWFCNRMKRPARPLAPCAVDRDGPGAVRAERRVAEPVPADRRLRVPVRLREHLPDLVGRFGGVAVRAAAGLAQRVRGHPGPRRRPLPARALRRLGARRAPLPAGQPDPGDHLADPHRLGHRARRAGDGPVARHRDAVAHPPPHPDGLGCRAHPAAHGAVRQRHRRAGDELRAVVRLPPRQRQLGVLGPGLRRGDRARHQGSRLASDACG